MAKTQPKKHTVTFESRVIEHTVFIEDEEVGTVVTNHEELPLSARAGYLHTAGDLPLSASELVAIADKVRETEEAIAQ